MLQVDGYAGYDRQADAQQPGGPLVLAYCWSHFRRFYDIAKAGNASIASEALRRIGELYAIEAEISGRAANERRADRQARTKTLVEAFRIRLDRQLERIPRRSPLAEAMRYGMSHWKGLCRSSRPAYSTPSTRTPGSLTR